LNKKSTQTKRQPKIYRDTQKSEKHEEKKRCVEGWGRADGGHEVGEKKKREEAPYLCCRMRWGRGRRTAGGGKELMEGQGERSWSGGGEWSTLKREPVFGSGRERGKDLHWRCWGGWGVKQGQERRENDKKREEQGNSRKTARRGPRKKKKRRQYGTHGKCPQKKMGRLNKVRSSNTGGKKAEKKETKKETSCKKQYRTWSSFDLNFNCGSLILELGTFRGRAVEWK